MDSRTLIYRANLRAYLNSGCMSIPSDVGFVMQAPMTVLNYHIVSFQTAQRLPWLCVYASIKRRTSTQLSQ